MPVNLYAVVREVRKNVLVSEAELSGSLRVQSKRLREVLRPGVGEILDRCDIGGVPFYRLAPDRGLLVGVDLQQEGGRLAIRELDFSPAGRGAWETLPSLHDERDIDVALVDLTKRIVRQAAAFDRKPLVGVGVALPAPVDRNTGEAAAHFILPGWESCDVATRLQELLAKAGINTKVVVGNDGSLGALGVFTRAKVQDPVHTPDDLVYVRLASGIGSGIVLKGHLVTGSSGFAGELGHIKVADDGPLCPRCGGRGCLEVFAGNDAVRREIVSTTNVDCESFEDVMRVDHPATLQALRDAGHRVGIALAHVCTLINPAWFVLDGQMSGSEDFCDAVIRAIRRRALPQSASGQHVLPWRLLLEGWTKTPTARTGWPGEDELSPELMGALALVVDTFGDEFFFPGTVELESAQSK